jgi:hypothetical protein
VDLFYAQGFGIVSQLPGYQDGYYNNWLYTTANGGNYGGGQTCSGGAATVVVRLVWRRGRAQREWALACAVAVAQCARPYQRRST